MLQGHYRSGTTDKKGGGREDAIGSASVLFQYNIVLSEVVPLYFFSTCAIGSASVLFQYVVSSRPPLSANANETNYDSTDGSRYELADRRTGGAETSAGDKSRTDTRAEGKNRAEQTTRNR